MLDSGLNARMLLKNDGWQIPDVNLKNLFGTSAMKTGNGVMKILMLLLV